MKILTGAIFGTCTDVVKTRKNCQLGCVASQADYIGGGLILCFKLGNPSYIYYFQAFNCFQLYFKTSTTFCIIMKLNFFFLHLFYYN